ncbi:hypothetical protein [Thiolapillus sp.]
MLSVQQKKKRVLLAPVFLCAYFLFRAFVPKMSAVQVISDSAAM